MLIFRENSSENVPFVEIDEPKRMEIYERRVTSMKKLLALVLALVMTLSLAVVGSNAAFKDADKVNETYSEAVNVLSGMKVFQGYTDGSFQPTGDITRAEVAAIVYRLYTGDVTDKQASLYATYNKFSDMDGAAWAKGYIGYCANAGLIKGYDDKTFGPADKVTGYQALAMILRAVGYDKNDEFTGAQWQLRVASTAQQAGVLVNVKGVDLNAPASRELVAELLFRTAATVPMVKYTPAFGYVANSIVGNQKTLGEQNFDLKLSTTVNADVWGRPANVWTYNTGDKKTTVVAKPVVSYTVKVDECDIAKDLGISTSKAIEGAYIDGYSYAKNLTSADVTSNRYATINPLATTSYVGAQGRLTEVYDMGAAGYRIVEINTYLAQITKVTPAYTDRNSHVTVDTVDLKAYTTSNTTKPVSFAKVEATGFTVGQYVLVTISNVGTATAAVESVAAAEVVAGGKLTGWTNEVGTTAATTVVAGTTYKDANKFFLNYRAAGNWMVATDSYGNAIGLVESASNYLAVARIEWKANATSFGGYALADVVLANGEVKNDVTIASVNGNAANATGSQNGNFYTQGVPTSGSVSIYWTNNSAYYNHIMAYSVNADGSYNLMNATHYTNAATKSDKVVDLGGPDTNTVGTASYNNSTATISDQTNTVVATDNTVFLYVNENGYSYTVYTGKNNAPSITAAKMCVKFDSYGYAELVVVRSYTAASNTFIAYVTDKTVDGYAYPNGTQVPAYTVYKLGSLDATTVYDATVSGTTVTAANAFATAFDGQSAGQGLYKFEVTSDGYIKSMALVLAGAGAYATKTEGTEYFDRATVKAPVVGNSFQTEKTTGTVNKDFNVLTDPATSVIKVVTYSDGTVALAAGTTADITEGAKVLVNYNGTASLNKYNAKVVYVAAAESSVNPDADKSDVKTLAGKGTVTIGSTVVDIVDKAYVSVDLALKNAKTLTGYNGSTMPVAVSNTNDWVALGVYDNAALAAQVTLPANSGSTTASGTYVLSTNNVILVAFSENFVNYYVAYVIG